MRKYIVSFFLLTSSFHSFAFDFIDNGIAYNITSTTPPLTVEVTLGLTYSGKLIIPSKVGLYEVTSIGENACNSCYSLTSVTIPHSVKQINYGAFANCSNLSSVIIPNSVTIIGRSAFENCSNLSSISIPNSVNTIENRAFSQCWSLTHVSIPYSVSKIEENVFYNCKNLISFIVDSSNPNYSSEEGVLFNKDKTVLISYPIKKTGSYIIPNSVVSIGSYTFSNCIYLTSVIIPNSVISIGISAFSFCVGLNSTFIPNSVIIIGESAFWQTGLTSIIIPDSVTEIGDFAFGMCENLTKLTISNSLNKIGLCAFTYCSNLTEIHIKAINPPILSYYNNQLVKWHSTFDNVNKTTCVLFVPIGSILAYQTAEQWKDFSNIVEETTSISALAEDKINICISNDRIMLTNLSFGIIVQVITSEGKVIYQSIVKNETLSLKLRQNQTYIIKAGDKIVKIII